MNVPGNASLPTGTSAPRQVREPARGTLGTPPAVTPGMSSLIVQLAASVSLLFAGIGIVTLLRPRASA